MDDKVKNLEDLTSRELKGLTSVIKDNLSNLDNLDDKAYFLVMLSVVEKVSRERIKDEV